MTVLGMRSVPQRPSIDDLVSRAADIGGLVRDQAERAEADRSVSLEAIARMRTAGLFRIMQPAIYGGHEYGFDALVRVVAPVAAGEAFQRAWRDAHAAAVHVSLNWDAVSTMYGQHALGLEPKGQY